MEINICKGRWDGICGHWAWMETGIKRMGEMEMKFAGMGIGHQRDVCGARPEAAGRETHCCSRTSADQNQNLRFPSLPPPHHSTSALYTPHAITRLIQLH